MRVSSLDCIAVPVVAILAMFVLVLDLLPTTSVAVGGSTITEDIIPAVVLVTVAVCCEDCQELALTFLFCLIAIT